MEIYHCRKVEVLPYVPPHKVTEIEVGNSGVVGRPDHVGGAVPGVLLLNIRNCGRLAAHRRRSQARGGASPAATHFQCNCLKGLEKSLEEVQHSRSWLTMNFREF